MGHPLDDTRIADLARSAGYLNSKSVISSKTLPRFLEDMLSYRPWWLRVLFLMQNQVAGRLGLTHHINRMCRVRINGTCFEPDQRLGPYTTLAGDGITCWSGQCADDHLRTALAVSGVPLPHGGTRYYVMTLVFFKTWLGKTYMIMILPLHHMITASIMRHAARA